MSSVICVLFVKRVLWFVSLCVCVCVCVLCCVVLCCVVLCCVVLCCATVSGCRAVLTDSSVAMRVVV